MTTNQTTEVTQTTTHRKITRHDGTTCWISKGSRLVYVETLGDGRYVVTDEIRADGTRLAGPTITAAEWHRLLGGAWTHCNGSRTTPNADATCRTCGNGVMVRQDGTAWTHKRPHGFRLARIDGTWTTITP